MTCNEAFYLIQRHFDGELTSEEQILLDQHLHACANCQSEFDAYDDLFGDIDLLVKQVEHRDVLSKTLARLEEAKQKRRMDMWWRGVAVAASVLVIATTAVLSLTNTGRTVRREVAGWMQHPVAQSSSMMQASNRANNGEMTVTDNPEAAQKAIAKIRQAVTFPLLELHGPELHLVSTSLYGGDQQSMYQMVELEYAISGERSDNVDKIYFLATPDPSLKSHSKYNIGDYVFNGEIQAGPFKWARVGEHALTAQINGVFYQLYSPFKTINELAPYAAGIHKQ